MSVADQPEWPELAPEGSGSFFEIAAYITRVIAQRTTVHDDATAAEPLGRGIAYSVLSRLRDTSGLTVRADELAAAHDAGYRKAEAKYASTAARSDAVDDALSRLRGAVEELTSTEGEQPVNARKVEIVAYPGYAHESSTRPAMWSGDPGWISVPREGDTWFHCGDWAGETFTSRISWCGPGGSEAAHSIEIENVGVEVVAHLVADHGFEYLPGSADGSTP